jgi:hypothetical protein
MTGLVSLGVGLILLFLCLSIAMSFPAWPMGVFKTTGALKAARWLVRVGWRSVVLTIQIAAKTRRLHIRRPGARQRARRAG